MSDSRRITADARADRAIARLYKAQRQRRRERDLDRDLDHDLTDEGSR